MKSKIKQKIIDASAYTLIACGVLIMAPFVMIALLFWEIVTGLFKVFVK